MSDVDPKLVAANTRFGFKLFSQILEARSGGESTRKNVMISPVSIATALSMVYNGAAGKTQQGMATALELQGLSLQDLNQSNAALVATLESADPEVKLKIANSLWGRAGFSFNPDFLNHSRMFYGAEMTSLDFASAAAIGQINDWVSRSTDNKITQIVDRIKPEQILFLINAVYFKGNWSTPFDPSQTKEQPFTQADGTQKQQPLMSQQGSYAYYETEQFQAVRLPYGKGRLSMYVFLPRSQPNSDQPDSNQSNLDSFYQSLSAANWDTWMQQFAKRRGMIQLPKFKFESESNLNDALIALGMGDAFTDQADFSQLSSSPTQISEVKHKTFIEVNEAGTEAAAATSVAMATRAAINVTPPFQMIVNRPFFCAIRDDQTGTLLFMGAVSEPK
jgi:serpin B